MVPLFMKALCNGFYATRIYIPFSRASRYLRGLSRRLRGKKSQFMQGTSLPQIGWHRLPHLGLPRIWESGKENGNVRISELAILSALAAGCPEKSAIFEIGTFDGRTTLNLALNADLSCPIYTLDLPPGQETVFQVATGEQHMIDKPSSGSRYERYRASHRPQVSRIHQLYGDSASYDYSAHLQSCSLIFVDGSHAYDYAIADTRTAMRLVRKGGIIVWHDYGIWEGVTRALEQLDQEENLGLRHITGTSLVYWLSP